VVNVVILSKNMLKTEWTNQSCLKRSRENNGVGVKKVGKKERYKMHAMQL